MTKDKKHKKRKEQENKTAFSSLEKFLKHEILAFFKKNKSQTYTAKQVAMGTGLWEQAANTKIRATLDKLVLAGELGSNDKGQYKWADAAKAVTLKGKLQVTRSGVGFVMLEDGEELFIPQGSIGKCFDGDTVLVRLSGGRKSREGKRAGEIVSVVERSQSEIVGVVEILSNTCFLVSDDPRHQTEFYIAEAHRNGARHGDKVVARMLNWERRSPEVEVLRILGAAGENQTEMHAILFQYGFQPDFPPEVEAEARVLGAGLPEEEIARRRDFRGITTLTIDPVDAKDFDDALSFKRLDNGRFEVGIHIADVSWYVQPGSALDREALNRATSVYLVDRTVPMLPEALSNHLCSLRPHEDKFTYSAVFQLDNEGKVHSRWFGRTIIHSDHRFSYEEAEQVLKGEAEGPFREELVILNQLAYKLREQRFATGSIDFDTPEIKFELDGQGRPLRVLKKIRGDSNRLIEDFMLLANREVAAHVARMADHPPLPFVYRVHDRPDVEKLQNLQRFVKGFGYYVEVNDSAQIAPSMNRLMHQVQGKAEQNVIESIAIRAMSKAIYTTQNIGHYGLGFKHYTHFTSPIRRYPDLLVHRLLFKYEHGQLSGNPAALEAQCKLCSAAERKAAEAERASIKYKQVEFMQDKIGQDFDAIVSGVIENGLFAELQDSLAEGFIPVWSLQDDAYSFDAEHYCLRSRRGKVVRLGDPIRVRVTGVNLRKRQIEMEFVSKREV